jgi:hypothetical protein
VKPYYADDDVTVHHGDCLDVLRCVLIERETDYLPLIRARLSKPIQPTLGEVAP